MSTNRPGQRTPISSWLVVMGAGATLLLSGCGVASDATAAPPPAATVTVIVRGPTATATRTATVRITKTVTASPTSSPLPTQRDTSTAALPSPTAGSNFDRQYAVTVVANIIDDIKTIDFRLHDGIMVSSRLWMLSNDYDRLSSAGTPPATPPANYQARLSTLSTFAQRAGNSYDNDPIQGAATYVVVRRESGPLFAQLNAALGTNFRLPRS